MCVQCATRFSHSGDLGDIIYALPTIKALGGGELIVCETGIAMHGMNETKVASLSALVVGQCGISSCTFHVGVVDVDYSLDAFRSVVGGNIVQQHQTAFSLPLAHEPWLAVEPLHMCDVVINRTARYHGRPGLWKQVVSKYSCVFIGTVIEWRSFCREFGFVRYHACSDLLDVARCIAGAKLFVGNQSACLAIAEGLGVDVVAEIFESADNCRVSRAGRFEWVRGPFSLPNLV